MKEPGRAEQWGVLGATALLAVLCVVGAFLGKERASAMFTSAPLVAFWSAAAVLLAAAVLRRRAPGGSGGVFVATAGVLLILLGSMWGSRLGHSASAWLLGIPRVHSGFLYAFRGQAADRVLDPQLDRLAGTLPFSLKLLGFRVVHYAPSDETPPAEEPPVPNYGSEVAVIVQGREVMRKVISVNHPLQYGGQAFYHWSCNADEVLYTVLLVKSAAGRTLAFVGFAFLCAGVFWACWKQPVWSFVRRWTGRDGA